VQATGHNRVLGFGKKETRSSRDQKKLKNKANTIRGRKIISLMSRYKARRIHGLAQDVTPDPRRGYRGPKAAKSRGNWTENRVLEVTTGLPSRGLRAKEIYRDSIAKRGLGSGKRTPK